MEGGHLTELGQQQVAELAESLKDERIAAIYTSPLSRAVESANIAGEILGLTPEIMGSLSEYDCGEFDGIGFNDPRAQELFQQWGQGDLDEGFPDGETGADVVKRYDDALREIADLHRGESVLVLSHGGAMSLAIPKLARRADLVKTPYIPHAHAVRAEQDGDGFRVLSWPGVA